MKQMKKYWLWVVFIIVLVLVLVLVLVRVLVWFIWIFPETQIPAAWYDAERLKLVAEYQRTSIQVIGGIVVLIGLGVAWWRSKAAMKQAKATEQGNITERFSRAVEQLGATRQKAKDEYAPNMEMRLGGIYTLEHIQKDDPQNYHEPVVNLLVAYVRENTAGPVSGKMKEPKGTRVDK